MNILEYENYHEKKSHSLEDFPYNTYPCSIPLDFQCVPAHWHDDTEIIYIKKGRGLITVDLIEYPVSAGSILFIYPGQVHSIEQSDGSSMEYINIIFKLEMLLSKQTDICNRQFFVPLLDGTLHLSTHFTPGMPYYDEIAGCINAADRVCQTRPPAYEMVVKGQLYLVFQILFAYCCEKQSSRRNQKSLEKMKFIVKYIENNYMNRISIEEVSQVMGLSQSHFMKFFKNTMGTTFTDYLNDYRLTMASRLLISSEASILAIATEVGFDNLSYFNRLFKKRFYITPREYRKRYAS